MNDVKNDTLLRYSQVSKQFGEFEALSEVNLEVARGEKVALMGRSGSGKTTLLRIAMTLEPVSAGKVEIDGLAFERDIRERRNRELLRQVRARVGMVFQHFNLFENLTAQENIALPLRRVKLLSKAEAKEKAQALLERVGLARQSESFPKQLSGGQAQRVAIARALALEPALLLFDEPTSALDPELVGEVLEVIRDVALHTNATLLIVTHELAFAAEVADRMVYMDGGRVIEEGSPRILLEQPKHERTQQFLSAVFGRQLRAAD